MYVTIKKILVTLYIISTYKIAIGADADIYVDV